MYGACGNMLIQFSYPVRDPESAAAMGLIPVELDIESLYEVQDRKRRKSANKKPHASQALSVCTNQHIFMTKLKTPSASARSESSLAAGLLRQEKEAHE
jgi:hypothetical protein